MEGKYIIFDEMIPVVFPATLQHVEVATGISRKPTSAGFFCTDEEDGDIEAYGGSVSLKLDSREEDAELIDRLFASKRTNNEKRIL